LLGAKCLHDVCFYGKKGIIVHQIISNVEIIRVVTVETEVGEW